MKLMKWLAGFVVVATVTTAHAGDHAIPTIPVSVVWSAISDSVSNRAVRTRYGKGAEPLAPEDEENRRDGISTAMSRVVVMGADALSLSWIDRAALIYTLWNEESAFEYHVHAGLVSPLGHQDHGKARCFGQIHESPFIGHDDWLALAGLDVAATDRCAEWTMRAFAAQANRCIRRGLPRATRWRRELTREEAAVLFAGYGTNSCTPEARHYYRADRFMATRRAMLRFAANAAVTPKDEP